jgi:hypothetical protein
MRCLISSAVLAAIFACCGNARADDNKSDAKPNPSSEYTTVNEIDGAILSIPPGDKGTKISLRVDQKLLTNGGSLGSALDIYRGRTLPQLKDMPKDVGLDLTPDVKVRRMKLPPKKDEKGHTVPYTEKEKKELKGDTNLKGYSAELGDLKPGQILSLHIVKLKGAKGEDAKKVFVSRIFIQGEGQAPPPLDNNRKKP